MTEMSDAFLAFIYERTAEEIERQDLDGDVELTADKIIRNLTTGPQTEAKRRELGHWRREFLRSLPDHSTKH